jgi:2-isopropylmalate synthase
MPARVTIFDTTLRDGEQSPGASLTVDQKFDIARQLARLKVDVIEAGFPIASEGDFRAVKMVAEGIKGPTVAGLCRAREEDIDRAWEALKNGENVRIHTFIATSDIHLRHKLKMSREEVLQAAVKAVQRARGYTDDVEFSAEDATRSDLDYLCRVIEAVVKAGATTVNIPDTVGYAVPHEYGPFIAKCCEAAADAGGAVISVHCHNDLGLAVANTLTALANGARQAECTVNGLGERAGNASLEEIVMALKVRQDQFDLYTDIQTREIHRTSRMVSDLTGMPVQPNKAIVGRNAFAHEAGIHQHGVIEEKKTYEIMDAKSIGLTESTLVLGKHSGRHAVEKRLRELGFELTREELDRVFYRFKDMADQRKQIGDRDLESIVSDEIYAPPETFRLEYMQIVSGTGIVPTATVRLSREGAELSGSHTGVGSVDAVYTTIARLVNVPHHLLDFSVQSVTGGTDALGEVRVQIADEDGRIFTGTGSHMDIIEASARAYLHAINKLVNYGKPAR